MKFFQKKKKFYSSVLNYESYKNSKRIVCFNKYDIRLQLNPFNTEQVILILTFLLYLLSIRAFSY